MQNFINNIDTWKAAKNPLCVILLDTVGDPPINGTSALEVKKWGSSCFQKMHSLPLGYRTNGKRIINLFYWFACLQACHYDPESKAFLCTQGEKDEEEWKETNINIDM